jgi:hypothetical protein
VGRVSAFSEPLVVDPVVHAAEIARFEAKIVVGPGEHCSIWRGAIGDDGYGRFSITRGGRERTVKPHRYAAAYRLGVPIEVGEVVEHVVCDNPICCRAHPDRAIGHVWPSTQGDNLRRMAHRGRGGGSRWWVRRWSGLSRPERAERSRALAAAVRGGWDEAAVRAVLLTINPAQPALFHHHEFGGPQRS